MVAIPRDGGVQESDSGDRKSEVLDEDHSITD